MIGSGDFHKMRKVNATPPVIQQLDGIRYSCLIPKRHDEAYRPADIEDLSAARQA
jgi:hypothetical protein